MDENEKHWAGTWIERPQSISLCNRCVFVGWRHLKHTPSPCKNWALEVLHLFRCFTHMPRCRGAFLRPRRMRWRWKWRKDENEMTMKMRWQSLNQNTRGGTQKGKGKRENTNTPGPRRANPERARKKKKRTTGQKTNQRRGGGQNGTRRTQTWPREGKRAWDRGTIGT